MDKILITLLFVTMSLSASTVLEEVNIFSGRGVMEIQSDCSTVYVATPGKTQMSLKSGGSCAGVNDSDHWAEIDKIVGSQTIKTVIICKDDGTEGDEVLKATEILNPAPEIILPEWDNGGKDEEYIYYNSSGDEVITTYIGYCSSDTAKKIDEGIAEAEVNVYTGDMTREPLIEGIFPNFGGTPVVKKSSSCSNYDDKNWIVESGVAKLCASTGSKVTISGATPYVDGVPSSGCEAIQKLKYEAYKLNLENQNSTESNPQNCQNIVDDTGYTSNELNNLNLRDSSQMTQKSADKDEKFLKEIKNERFIAYMIALGYRYIPKIKDVGIKAKHINKNLQQSFYGMFGAVKFNSSEGLEHKNTISKTTPTMDDYQQIATFATTQQGVVNDGEYDYAVPYIPTLNVYKLNATSGSSHGMSASYPRPLTATFSGGDIGLSFEQLTNLYNNDRFQDENGNFAFDLYFEGAGAGQIGIKAKNCSTGAWSGWLRPTLVENGGARIGTREGIYGATGLTGQSIIIRYTLPEVPCGLSYSLDDFAMFTAYKGFTQLTSLNVSTDYSNLKMDNLAIIDLLSILNRIYGYNKVDDTWNLGTNPDGSPGVMKETPTIDGGSRKLNQIEALSFRLTASEFNDILDGARNGVEKYINQLSKILGRPLSELPIFKFKLREYKMNVDLEVLVPNSPLEPTCTGGRTYRTKMPTSGAGCVETYSSTPICENWVQIPYEDDLGFRWVGKEKENDLFYLFYPEETYVPPVINGEWIEYKLNLKEGLYKRTCKYQEPTMVCNTVSSAKICSKNTVTVNKEYKFAYNPFENDKAILGESMERVADAFAFIDLYSSKYAVNHNMGSSVVTSTMKNEMNKTVITTTESVEGLLGKTIPNPDLESCINTLMTTGFQFKETRNSTDGAIKDYETNFLKSPITVFTHIKDDLIENALERAKDEEATAVRTALNELLPYLDDAYEDAVIESAIKQFKSSLEFQDNVDIYIQASFLEASLTSAQLLSLSEIINNINYPNTIFPDINEDTIVETFENWAKITEDKENILMNLIITELYIYDGINDTSETFTLLNPVLLKDIFSASTDAVTGDVTFTLVNKENKGIVYLKNGSYISTKEVETLLNNASHIGILADNIERTLYKLKFSTATNYSVNRDNILAQSVSNTEDICANALYFDYEADRLIREKLDAWDLLIKKTSEYLTKTNPKMADFDKSNPELVRLYNNIINSRLSGIINHRVESVKDQRKCDSINWKIFGYSCEPGNVPGRVGDLRRSSGADISGTQVINYVKAIANSSPIIATLDIATYFDVNGETETLEGMGSTIYQDGVAKLNVPFVWNSPNTSGGIHQYLPDYQSDRDYSRNPLCPNCNMIDFKNRSMVAQEVVAALEALKVAFHKRISGYIDLSSYEKCRNDLHSMGYTKIKRNLFNPKFLETNPENLVESGTASFAPTIFNYSVGATNVDQVTTATVKMNPGSVTDVTYFCSNLISPTKFFANSNVIIPTMENIYGVNKTIGAILVPRYYPNAKANKDTGPEAGFNFLDVWGDKNLFQAEICSSLNVNTQTLTSNTSVLSCSNPKVPELGVDKNLIDIGIALFDNPNGRYNASTYPFKRASIEFIDLYEMVQDNETGTSQSMFGSLSLQQQLDELGDYNKKDKLETAYEECLKFKAKVFYKQKIDSQGNTQIYEAFDNAQKYFSYKADVCTSTDNGTPPAYVEGEYAHNGCPSQLDKLITVRKCNHILTNNSRAVSYHNHTCADVDIDAMFKSPIEERRKEYDLDKSVQDGFDSTLENASKQNALLKQGVEKNIDENGRITTSYSNSDAAIIQMDTNEINGNGGKSASGNKLSNNSSFDSVINSMKSETINQQQGGTTQGVGVDMSETKSKKSRTESSISALGGRGSQSESYYNRTNTKVNNGSYMDIATSSTTGGVTTSVSDADLTEQEKLSIDVAGTSNVQDIDKEMATGRFKADQYDLNCNNCGGFVEVTMEEVNTKKTELLQRDDMKEYQNNKSNAIDTMSNPDGSYAKCYDGAREIRCANDAGMINSARGEDKFNVGSKNKNISKYYEYKDPNNRRAAGNQAKNELSDGLDGINNLIINEDGSTSNVRDEMIENQQTILEQKFSQSQIDAREINQ